MFIPFLNILIFTPLSYAAIENTGQSNISFSETNTDRAKRGAYSLTLMQRASGPFVARMLITGVTGTYLMLVDTASLSTWVPTELLVQTQKVELLSFYPTPTHLNFGFRKSYKGSELYGQCMFHEVTISFLRILTLALGVVHEAKPIPKFLGAYEGVFGLAPDFAGEEGYESFCSWIRKYQPPEQRYFTLWYPLLLQVGYGDAELSIGIFEPTHMQEPLVYSQLTSTELWSMRVEKILFGDHQLCNSKCEVVLDSGIGVGFGPVAALETAAPEIGVLGQTASGLYIVDCNGLEQGPPLKVDIDGHLFQWKMEDFAGRGNFNGVERCYFGFRPDPRPVEGRWTFGHLLLRKLYTVFDVENRIIGVATANFPYPERP